MSSDAFPSPFSIETPRVRGLGGDVPVLRAVRRAPPRDRRGPASGSGTRCTSRCRCRPSTSICIDRPYYAVGVWQNRVFAVPPAMGVDYRMRERLHLHLGQPGHRPGEDRRARRVLPEARRLLLPNWDELYGEVAGEDGGADRASCGELEVPDLPEYEPDEVAFGDDRNTQLYDAARRVRPHPAAGRADVAAPLRVPAARLRRVPDVLGVLQGATCPTSPTSTSRRWSPASTCCCSAPDAELRRLARLAIDTGVDGAFVAGPHAGRRSTPSWPRARPAARGSTELEEVKDPWFNMAHRRRPLPLLPQLARRPEHPVRVADRPHRRAAARARTSSARPSSSRASATGWPRSTRRCSTRTRAARFDELLGAVADGVPVRRGAQVLLRLLVPDALLQQDPRVRRAARRSTASSRTARTSSSSRATRCSGARGAVPDVGDRRRRRSGRTHWPPIVARRRELLERLEDVDAAAGARRDARGGQRPDGGDAVGRDHRARAGVGAQSGGRRAAARRRGVARRRSRARRACVKIGRADRPTCARARSSSARSPRRRGRRSSPRSRPRSPTSAA